MKRGETSTTGTNLTNAVVVTLREKEQRQIHRKRETERENSRSHSTSLVWLENTLIHSSCHFPLYSFASVIAEWSDQFIFKLRGYIHCFVLRGWARGSSSPIPVSALRRETALFPRHCSYCMTLIQLSLNPHRPNPPLKDLRGATKIPGSYQFTTTKKYIKQQGSKKCALHMCKPSQKLCLTTHTTRQFN